MEGATVFSRIFRKIRAQLLLQALLRVEGVRRRREPEGPEHAHWEFESQRTDQGGARTPRKLEPGRRARPARKNAAAERALPSEPATTRGHIAIKTVKHLFSCSTLYHC